MKTTSVDLAKVVIVGGGRKGTVIFLKHNRCNWLNHTTWSLDILMVIRGYNRVKSKDITLQIAYKTSGAAFLYVVLYQHPMRGHCGL